ncbi:MAG: diguanylate cyclase [Acidimicrobiales bacterium]
MEWTRESITALTRNAKVSARDSMGEYVPLPGWLVDPSVEEMTFGLVEFVESVHPDDRSAVVELYGSALASPGEVISEHVRFGPVGEREHIDLKLVNLCDHPDVGAMLAIAEPTGLIENDLLDAGPGGGHRPTGWMLLDVDLEGVIKRVEGDSMSMLGYEPHEMVGRLPAEFYLAEDVLASIRVRQALAADPNATITSRRKWIRRDGSTVWIENSYARRPNPLPGQGDVLVVMWDITDKIADEEALRTSQANLRLMAENFQALADEVPAAVFQCGVDGAVGFHNARWSRLAEEHDRVERVRDLACESARPTIDSLFARMAASGHRDSQSVEFTGADGDTHWRLNLRTVAQASDGEVSFVGSLEDVTSTVRLRDRARQDPLTKLMNRTAVEAFLSDALTTSLGDLLVVFLDLDRFKTVNDTWGHDVGDLVLVEVARRLTAHTRPSDAVGRWGGDEFVVVLRHGVLEHGQSLVERIRGALDDPVEFEGGSWRPKASIGFVNPSPEDSVDSSIRRADQAMFAEKRRR